MTGKTERQMAMDYRGKSPGWSVRVLASHEVSKKNRNAENRDIDFVNE